MEGNRMGVILRISLASLTMVGFLSLGGCKQQQQMKEQIDAVDSKMAESQKRITFLDNELKKTNIEITQLKALVTRLGNVVVDLQKAEDERAKAAEAAKLAAAHQGTSKKKPAGKKHH